MNKNLLQYASKIDSTILSSANDICRKDYNLVLHKILESFERWNKTLGVDASSLDTVEKIIEVVRRKYDLNQRRTAAGKRKDAVDIDTVFVFVPDQERAKIVYKDMCMAKTKAYRDIIKQNPKIADSKSLEAITRKYGAEKAAEIYEKRRHDCGIPKRLSYFIAQGMTESEAREALASSQATFSLEKCIKRHGEEMGRKVWEERQKKWQNSLAEKSAEEIAEMNSKKAITLDRMIAKHGKEEGPKRYDLWIESIKRKNTEEYYRELYGEEGVNLRRKRYETAAWKRSYGYLATQLGEEEAAIVWTERYKTRYYSEESIEFFERIVPPHIMQEAHYGENEFFLWDKSKSIFFYDFKFKDVIVEYHGHAFHPNVKVLSEDELKSWRNPFDASIGWEEALSKDLRKKDVAESHGYKFFEIFSNDPEDLKESKIRLIQEALLRAA